MPRTRKHPTTEQFESLRSKAKQQKRGLARVMTAAGFSLKSGTAGTSRTDWIVA